MLYRPFKRVGEPSSFKGLKGPYLFLAMYYIAAGLFGVLIVFLLPISKLIQIVIVAILALFILFKINGFKKECKDGDIFFMVKSKCRKNINIKGTPCEIKKSK